MPRKGLLRFGSPTFATPASAARWLEHLAALLRHLEEDTDWSAADLDAAQEQRGLAPAPGASPKGPTDLNTVAEVAEYARVSTRTIRRAVATGELKVVRASPRKVRVTDAAVEEWLKRSARKP